MIRFNINIFILILILIFLDSCKKIKYYPDTDFVEVKTKILAHRAGGNSQFIENSLEAARNSFPLADGIEVDVQISKDRTLWLAHDADLPDCGGVFYDCFPEVSDDAIMRLDSCRGDAKYYSSLEEIFSLMATSFPEKYISLDVKAWVPCAFTSSDILGVMNVIGDEIIRLTKKYSLQNYVLVESETATFLNYVKRNSTGIGCYLAANGDFERAMQLSLESGFQGISFKYKFKEEISADHINLIRKKGLKIQLWTVNSEDDLNEALLINPDFIQTDNLSFFENSY